MTDITALMSTMKAAAEKVKHAGEAPVMHFDDRISALNAFQLAACPANILALVEALEKAQRHSNLTEAERQAYLGLIAGRDERIADLEKRNAELGREVIHLQSLKTVNAARQEAESEFHRGYSCGHKDASLESSTVTVKQPENNVANVGDSRWLWRQRDLMWIETLRAAGIQVIEGEGQ